MPDATLTAADPSTRTAALTEVRLALSMIISDPDARNAVLPNPAAPGSSTVLTDWLYARWWCGPGLRADSATPAHTVAQVETERGAARLEASRRTSAPSSSGWLVLAAAGDVLVAARLGDGPADVRGRDARITTSPDAVVSSSRPGLPPRPGDLVTLRLGASGLDPAHAWWWAHATRPEGLSDLALDRWYVHVRDLSAAAALVPVLLAAAYELGCPMTLKCPPTEAGYGRRDALVVYLPRSVAARAETALLRRAAAIEPHVRPDVPPLTRPLLPGVSRAQDPGRGSLAIESDAEADDQAISYGQLRCGQVASAARLLGAADQTFDLARLDDQTLTAALASVGIDVDTIDRVP